MSTYFSMSGRVFNLLNFTKEVFSASRTRTLGYLLALATLATLNTPSLKAGDRMLGIEDVLPSNTVAFGRTFDFSTLSQRLEPTALGKFCNNKETNEFLEELTFHREEMIDNIAKEDNIDRAILEKLFLGQYGMAFLGLDPEDGAPMLAVGIAFPEAMDNKAVYDAITAVVKQRISEQIPPNLIQKKGVDVLNLPIPGSTHPIFSENNFFVVLGNILIATHSEHTIDVVINNFLDPNGKKLSSNPLFQKVCAGCNMNPDCAFAYVNTKVAIPVLQALTTKEALSLVDALGLPSVEGLGASAVIQGEGMATTLYLYAPRQRSGLLNVLALSQGAEAAAGAIPTEAGGFFSARVNLEHLYTEIPRLMDAISATTGNQNMSKGIGVMALANNQSFFGVPAREVLATLGDSIIAQRGPSGMALRFDNANQAEFRKIISRMEKELGSSFTTINDQGFSIRYFNQSGSPIPLAPSYMLVGDRAIFVAANPQVLKSIIRQKTAGTVANSRDYQRVSSGMGQGYGLFCYVEAVESYGNVYDALVPFANVITAFPSISADPGLLPPGDELDKYFFGFAVGAKNTQEGLTFTSYSPVGACGVVTYALDKLVVNNPVTMGMTAAGIYRLFGVEPGTGLAGGGNAAP